MIPTSPPRTAKWVLQLLSQLSIGHLEMHLPNGESRFYGSKTESSGTTASLTLHDWRVCSAALQSGDIGFAEGYIAGDWSTPDLTELLTLLMRNRDRLEALVYGRWWGGILYRIKHWLNRNSRHGSRKNIQAHYDLGNPFYALWLDETMTYSSAWFGDHPEQSLAQAQQAKVRRALQECDIRPGQRILEIGCGWGGLAELAAGEWGAHVTGVTLSQEQLTWAQDRMHRAQLTSLTDLRLQDYRDITDGPFDAICSIEMFEAVGQQYWPDFFSAVQRNLAPGGKACIQTIVIAEAHFERYQNSTDFIQQYIFPGGMLPSRSVFVQQARAAGLEVIQELRFGRDYARTLQQWRITFLAQEQAVRAAGFDTRFIRVWEFYLAYCEAAFITGNTDVMQFTLRRNV
jgi:cyclopropane-fatty-acyl-phospholipid synthase